MKCGTVAVVGRANAGKSTLVNALVGEKVSIVSPKPQTTRDRIYGVLTTDEYQIVFEDTPGVYKAAGLLNSRMQKTVERTARDTDLILFVLDGHDGLKDDDLNLLAKYAKIGAPLIVALTKTDIMQKEAMPEELVAVSAVEGVSEVVPVSARKRRNVNELLTVILGYLQESEYVFDPEAVSDKSEKFMIAEIMREKILVGYDKEIPHGVAVTVNKFGKRPDGIYDVDLDIICEKTNHKAILIGKGGKALKETSTIAREAMERFLGAKVFLKTYVRVKENWRDNDALLRDYGYGANNDD
ncbi:MAG: GTPase Era [Clostridia bacterium]|nr:GTPase Era [Clostridia bacterium]MDY2900855.1 GTPase Era [Christensenellaceae bacterium]